MAGPRSSAHTLTGLPIEICGFLGANPEKLHSSILDIKNLKPHAIIYPLPPTSQDDLYNGCLASNAMRTIAQPILFRTYNPKRQVEGTAPNVSDIDGQPHSNANELNYGARQPFSMLNRWGYS